MAHDKRFAAGRYGYGNDIPSEKKQIKEWSAHTIKVALQEKITALYASGKEALGHKHLETLIKMQKYFDGTPATATNNIMFVTQFENQEKWQEEAKRHADRIRELEVGSDLATDTEEQSGADDSDKS